MVMRKRGSYEMNQLNSTKLKQIKFRNVWNFCMRRNQKTEIYTHEDSPKVAFNL